MDDTGRGASLFVDDEYEHDVTEWLTLDDDDDE
jgi:hypothetical protein